MDNSGATGPQVVGEAESWGLRSKAPALRVDGWDRPSSGNRCLLSRLWRLLAPGPFQTTPRHTKRLSRNARQLAYLSPQSIPGSGSPPLHSFKRSARRKWGEPIMRPARRANDLISARPLCSTSRYRFLPQHQQRSRPGLLCPLEQTGSHQAVNHHPNTKAHPKWAHGCLPSCRPPRIGLF
jgi:hypothetical protein